MAGEPADLTEYILGELTKRLDDVARRLEAGLNQMDGTYVRRDVYNQGQVTQQQEHLNMTASCTSAVAEVKSIAADTLRRVNLLEDGRTWLLRLCAGSVITALISVALAVASKK